MSAPFWMQNALAAFPAAEFRNGQVLLSAEDANTFWPAGQATVAEIVVVVQATTWAQGHIFTLGQNSIDDALQIRVTATEVQWAYRNTANTLVVISAPVPSTGVPHELRLVKTAGGVSGLIDGVQVASASDARGPVFLVGGDVPVTIGARSDLTNGFDGLISEVIARNVVLGAQARVSESDYLRVKYGSPLPTESFSFTDETDFSDGTTFTDTFKVSPAISVSPLFSAPGGQVQVAAQHGPGNTDDRVGLYALGETNLDAYLDWKYLNGNQSLPTTPLRSATLTFTVPGSPGQYFFRFLAMSGNQLTTLATSQTLTVETPVGAVYAAGTYEAGVYV